MTTASVSPSRPYLPFVCAAALLFVGIRPLGAQGYSGPGDSAPPSPSTPTPKPPSTPKPNSTPKPSSGGQSGNTPKPQDNQDGGKDAGEYNPSSTTWESWWAYNKDRYLLRARRSNALACAPGSADHFMGRPPVELLAGIEWPQESAISPLIPKRLSESVRLGSDPSLRAYALVALAKTGRDAAAAALVREQLAHADPLVVDAAFLAMGILGDVANVPALLEILDGADGARRFFAKNERREFPLRWRAQAAIALGLVASQIAEENAQTQIAVALAAKLASEDPTTLELRLTSALSLAHARRLPEVARAGTIESLRRQANNRKQELRVRAACLDSLCALSRDHAPENSLALANVRAILQDSAEKSLLREAALQQLGELGEENEEIVRESFALLEKTLRESKSEQERAFALLALGRLGGEGARALLLEHLQAVRTPIRTWAALGIGMRGDAARRRGDEADSIARLGLEAALEKGGELVQTRAYVVALGMFGDRASAPALARCLARSRDNALRGDCLVSLGLVGSGETLEEILALFRKEEGDPDLLYQAGIALGLLGGRAQVPSLLEWIQDTKRETRIFPAAVALGGIRENSSLTPLANLLDLRKAKPFCAIAAATALGQICRRTSQTWQHTLCANRHFGAFPQTLIAAGSGLMQFP